MGKSNLTCPCGLGKLVAELRVDHDEDLVVKPDGGILACDHCHIAVDPNAVDEPEPVVEEEEPVEEPGTDDEPIDEGV
jgi:hypothetical protein